MKNTFRVIASNIEARLTAGEFAPGKPIPPIRELAQTYGVAPMTVRRALSVLCSAGRLKTVPGVGTFVSTTCPLEGIVLVTEFEALEQPDHVWYVQWDSIAGAKEACTEAGIPLITVSEKDDPRKLIKGGYGFLIAFCSPTGTRLSRWTNAVLTAGLPYVSAVSDHGLPNFIARDLDAAVRKGLRRLHELGHRRVVLISRLRHDDRPLLRPVLPAGAEDMAVETCTVPRPMAHDIHRLSSVLAERLAEKFAAPDRPTAVLAGTGPVLQGTMQFLEDSGIRVPEDCSVIGISRRVFAGWKGRRITHFDNPHKSIAHRAVEELIKTAAGAGYSPGRILLEPEFFEGDTCGEVPHPVLEAAGEAEGGKCRILNSE